MKNWKKILLTLLFIFSISFFNSFLKAQKYDFNTPLSNFYNINLDSISEDAKIETLYNQLDLKKKGLTFKAFEYAIKGYQYLDKKGRLQNNSVLTIVDLDQPSYNKRMYVIDMDKKILLFNTWSAHGRGTGDAYAKNFSNAANSHATSLGMYITKETYTGNNGFSLRLIGLEPSNNNALDRAIVVHGAPYVSQSSIKAMGFIGRSWGCPAVSKEMCKPVINTIKGGSLMLLYHRTYKPSLKL